MDTEIIGFISIIIAVIAVILTLWQNVLTRRAVQSQVLLSLRELADEANYDVGIVTISQLANFPSYDEYFKETSEESQKVISSTVAFLNYGAHLVEEKLIPRQTYWNFYFWPYRVANEKLRPWWLSGIREEFPKRFSSFERMCREIGSISDEAIAKFDMKRHS